MEMQINKKPLPAVGYVRQSELLEKVLPVSSATFWRMIKSGEFPQPLKIAKRVTVWRWEDVQVWMAEREHELEMSSLA